MLIRTIDFDSCFVFFLFWTGWFFYYISFLMCLSCSFARNCKKFKTFFWTLSRTFLIYLICFVVVVVVFFFFYFIDGTCDYNIKKITGLARWLASFLIWFCNLLRYWMAAAVLSSQETVFICRSRWMSRSLQYHEALTMSRKIPF